MKGWIKAGHNVTLFSSKTNNLKDREKLDGIKIIRKGSQYLGVQISAFFYYQNSNSKYDFLVDQFHGLPFFTPLYSKKPKIAVIQETAGKVWFLNPFPFPLNLLIGLIGYITEPIYFLFYKTTKFATGSMSAKIDVSKMGIPLKNITVWPHGIIVKKVNTEIKKERKKTITFLGVLSKDKGIIDAIKSFKILSKDNYQFWIIGKPETENFGNKVKDLVKELELEERIKFWGFVALEKKFELLKRSHILVNPSAREGWGLVNIEANAMGTPVISYKAAGLTDSVKQNYSGVFTKANNPEGIANSVEILLKKKAKYSKLSKTSVMWSKKFNWQNSIKISFKTLQEILTNP
jgi:glycosyltransferase involved in cell wall biosynthesis